MVMISVLRSFLLVLTLLFLSWPSNPRVVPGVVELKKNNSDNGTSQLTKWKVSSVSSAGCQGLLFLAKTLMSARRFQSMITKISFSTCVMFKISTPRVCSGYIDAFKHQVFSVIQYGVLSSERLCRGHPYLYSNWSVEIPPEPELPRHDPAEWYKVGPERANAPTFKIIHVSDVHADNSYAPGSPSECLEPVCCNNDSTPTRGNSERSSRWGEYRCDTSHLLFTSLLEFIRNNFDAKVVYYTGDSSPHKGSSQSVETQRRDLKKVMGDMRELLPHAQIFPSLGNHESFPVDSFPSESSYFLSDTKWLYDSYADSNVEYFDKEVIDTMRKAGYYTTLVTKGLRLVSLNTNFCEKMNMWMIINNRDPFDQLKWLVEVLLKAEADGETVHIIGHHPPGSKDCHHIWSSNLNAIVSRFRRTVSHLFTGHMHVSSFQVRFDHGKALDTENVVFLAPSITPYVDFNPAFHVYDVDNSSNSKFVVTDLNIYALDVGRAHSNDTVKWELISPVKRDFNLTDLSPNSLLGLVRRMDSDSDLFRKFLDRYYRRRLHASKAKRHMLCELLTSVEGDTRPCDNMLN